MDCIRVSQNLYDYLDGELGLWRRQAVARHLEVCAACSSSFQFEVQLRQTLWVKCQDEPPAGLHDRILHALEESAERVAGGWAIGAPDGPIGADGGPLGDPA